jgi:apolipoprotein N-acyltransferase
MNLSGWKAYILSALGGVILSLGFTQLHIGWVVLFGLVPFLMIEDYIFSYREKYRSISLFLRILPGFVIWNIISIFWIWFATAPGSVVAILWNSLMMSFVFILYHKVRLRLTKKEAYAALIFFWIAFEFIYLRVILSFPWLLLGNAFANNIHWIQWYEYTGVLGGSLWALTSNLVLFEIIRILLSKEKSKKILRNLSIIFALIVILPLTFSIIRFNQYKEQGQAMNIIVLQPNIDPYKKFSNSVISNQRDMLKLADAHMDENVDYVVFPETALPLYIDTDSVYFENHPSIKLLRDYVNSYPNVKLIVGMTARSFYFDENEKTETAHQYEDFWFDEYNVSYQFDKTKINQYYYKSKLVPGVETLPLIEDIAWLNDMIIDLGGARNSLTTQRQRTVFKNPDDSVAVGTPICYESIYGEFVTGFVRNGANLLFIMTNDGWWKDTPGYRQHAMYARLRAIENRRSIARSANTGISYLINQKGEILDSRAWWIEDAFRGKIQANNKLSFYSRFGDYLGRISLFVSVLILLHLLSYTLMKKRMNNEQTTFGNEDENL